MAFTDPGGRSLGLVYLYKRGTFYPFAPQSGAAPGQRAGTADPRPDRRRPEDRAGAEPLVPGVGRARPVGAAAAAGGPGCPAEQEPGRPECQRRAYGWLVQQVTGPAIGATASRTQEYSEMTVQDQATTQGINLTEAAAVKVGNLLEQEGRDDLRLRIAVQPGGCSGLRYQLYFDERQIDGDLVTRVRRCPGGDRQDERPVPQRGHHRLRRHHREAGLHDRQPERLGILRLRRLVPLIYA